MSFDFTSKLCSLRIPSDKIQMDKNIKFIHEESPSTNDYNDNDIDEMLKEIGN